MESVLQWFMHRSVCVNSADTADPLEVQHMTLDDEQSSWWHQTHTWTASPTGQPSWRVDFYLMAAVLWSDKFVNKKLRKFKHRKKTFR